MEEIRGQETEQTWWQKNKRLLMYIGIVIIVVLALFALLVYIFGWGWTGFNGPESKVTTTMITPGSTTATPGTMVATEQQPAKTLWDWLGLLAALAIPVVVGFGVAWFTSQQGEVSARENKDNQQEAALQAYIDKMSELLLRPESEESTPLKQKSEATPEVTRLRQEIMGVRTLTTLVRLKDPIRKSSVLQFLHKANLIHKGNRSVNLQEADLTGITLIGTDLTEVDLSKANLTGADLRGAILVKADLSGTNLTSANLSDADLSGANLTGAELFLANLTGAQVTREQLDKAKTKSIILPGDSTQS